MTREPFSVAVQDVSLQGCLSQTPSIRPCGACATTAKLLPTFLLQLLFRPEVVGNAVDVFIA
jgi:hypothetical protein